MAYWWKQWPGRLEAELSELRANGIEYTFDTVAFQKGAVLLKLTHVLDGNPLVLEVKFPDLYPYFRFEVSAPELNLKRHQNPFEKNLCLIGRASENWKPTDTLAGFILEQLPKVIASAEGGDESLEERQGEPISEFYPYQGRMTMIDSAWETDPSITEGTLVMGMDEMMSSDRLAVIQIQDSAGAVLSESSSAITALFPQMLKARWVKILEPIVTADPKVFFEVLKAQYPGLGGHSWKRDQMRNEDFDIIGVTFPEEVGYKKTGEGWVFIVIRKHKIKTGKKKSWKYEYFFSKAGRAGLTDLQARIPALTQLSSKRVAIIGLGSIGAPSALEFARCGVKELRLLDDDYVEPGTTVRWPLGFFAACLSKTVALKNFIRHSYPYTKVLITHARLGAASSPAGQDKLLEDFLEGVDLLYDASAERGIHNLLSDLARERNIPYVIVSTTPGAWGGIVARFGPKRGYGCWRCFDRARGDEKVPVPPEDPAGSVQPTSCGNPTFTGANFDIQESVLTGVRLAVSSLLQEDGSGAYPALNWNAASLSLRKEGLPILPSWEAIEIPAYPDCICQKMQ